jgi:hypothetical protein
VEKKDQFLQGVLDSSPDEKPCGKETNRESWMGNLVDEQLEKVPVEQPVVH